nr:unnamed protein product [Callosobruchus analis]
MMSENNYNSMINGYTRIQGESKSCIDHIFLKTQESDENFNPILLNYTITDHHPILFQYSLPETKKKNQPENVKNYKTYINYTTLAQKLEKENGIRFMFNLKQTVHLNYLIRFCQNILINLLVRLKLKDGK